MISGTLSLLLARLPNSPKPGAGPVTARPTILIVAISGRALAQSAQRAGFRVLVADFFGDDDTLAAADGWARLPGSMKEGINRRATIKTLTKLATGHMSRELAPLSHDGGAAARSAQRSFDGPAPAQEETPIHALVLGSGFEPLPELVDELARAFPLVGSSGDAIRRVKDPHWLAETCAELSIPHPDIRFDGHDGDDWLLKTAGGAGGGHVRLSSEGTLAAGQYFQRRVPGESISALFAADGRKATLLGLSSQWTAPKAGSPYRYGGAVRMQCENAEIYPKIAVWLDRLTHRAALLGLCSADFIMDDGKLTLIEINPRPGATMDIFDDGIEPLISIHLKAARGLPFAIPDYQGARASLIAYANRLISRFPKLDWPDWAVDRQAAGSRLGPGDPICTILGGGETAAEARREAMARLARLEREWNST